MQRIAIIGCGCGGAGKSTLAVAMGSLLALPVYHLDRLFWKPGWLETARAEWASAANAVVRRAGMDHRW
jgi:adenylate kinase family enzyme